jgi:hypothetical protein
VRADSWRQEPPEQHPEQPAWPRWPDPVHLPQRVSQVCPCWVQSVQPTQLAPHLVLSRVVRHCPMSQHPEQLGHDGWVHLPRDVLQVCAGLIVAQSIHIAPPVPQALSFCAEWQISCESQHPLQRFFQRSLVSPAQEYRPSPSAKSTGKRIGHHLVGTAATIMHPHSASMQRIPAEISGNDKCYNQGATTRGEKKRQELRCSDASWPWQPFLR